MSFIFKITTTTSPQTFVIPCVDEGTFNATVDYGDGTGSQAVTAYNDSNLTHSFATAGQHTITIDGTFPNVRFNDNVASRVLVDEVVDLGDVGWVNFYRAFRDCTNLTTFNGGTADTSSVTTMQQMVFNCNSLTSLDLSNFDTSSVSNIIQMFYGCSSLTSLDLSGFDTSSVTTMYAMFFNCSDLTSLNLSNFDPSSVTDMSYMFNNCSSLTALDLSNFDTSSVNNMVNMFRSCSSLTSLDLSNFDTSNVTIMPGMFQSCSSLTSLNVSSFDTSNVTVMAYMFYNCSSLTNLDIKHFDISSVTNGTGFLQYANNALTTTQYDELLEAWAAQDVQPNVPWHFGDAQYTVETIADWYSPRGVSSLSIINNKLVSIADSTAVFGAAQQVDNLIVGNAYKIVGKATCSNSAAQVRIRVGSNSDVNDVPFNITATGSVTANSTFIATATTHYVGTIVTGHAANDTVTIDAGITVKEITNYTEANAASEIESSVEGNNAVEYKNIPQSARELYSLEDDTWVGSELVVNGDFATDSDWNLGPGWTISGGKAVANNFTASYQRLSQSLTTEIGKSYLIEGFCSDFAAGGVYIRKPSDSTRSDTEFLINSDGFFSFIFLVNGDNDELAFANLNPATDLKLDNVSVKEIIEVAS